jgi:hypothetical protein
MIKKKQLHRKKKYSETESRMVLTRRESLRLLELLENPPPMNEKFKRAMKRHSELIKTGTTHITPAGGNVFLELGFKPEEAARMLAESNQEIEAKLAKTSLYDVADHLRTPEEKALYLEVCIEMSDGDSDFIKKALADVARAKP